MMTVEFGFVPADQKFNRELCEHLMHAMFAHRADVQRLRLDTLPDGHTGYSDLILLIARPYGANGSEQNPLLIRIGPLEAIAAEELRYKTYVEPFTGAGKVAPRAALVRVGAIAAIAYEYIQGQQNEPPMSLRHCLLGDEDDGTNLERACRAVVTLFRDTLAKHPQANCWYADGWVTDSLQRPLWFYNTVLPPTIRLRDVELVAQSDAELALTNCLQLADTPGGAMLNGQQVYLRTDRIYPQLRVRERQIDGDQCLLRLYLYEHVEGATYPLDDRPSHAAIDMRRPFRPVAARIDVVGSAKTLEKLPTNLDTIVLQGRIETTRYSYLEQLRQHFFSEHLVSLPQGRFVCGDRVYENAIRRYHELLYPPRHVTTSLIHGDMNLGNILLSRLSNQATAAWLIDFDKTTNGGHAVFDAVKLEIEYKAHVLPRRLNSIEDFIRLENLLHQALINPAASMDIRNENRYVRDAYQFIATLRRVALQNLRTAIPPVEYYLGLIGYGLAALKYPNLYTDPAHEHLAGAHPIAKVQPLALAAYLSASFAATSIQQLEGVTVTDASFPLPTTSSTPLITLPRLIGRNSLLAQALRQFQTSEPVVLLHGPVGSGRSNIAQYLSADLQRQGYTIWRYPPLEEKTVERFIAGCTYLMQRNEAEPARIPPPLLHGWGREEDLLVARERLCALLEQHDQPIALVIRLSVADAELRSFVVEMANAVRRTALVLISDAPLPDLHVGLTLDIPPFTSDEVRAYLQQQRLSMSEHAIQRLVTASHGLPALLELLIRDIHTRYHLTGSYDDAIAQIEATHSVTRFMERRLREMHEPLRRLLALDELLTRHTPEVLAEEALGDTERLRQFVIAAAGWSNDRAVSGLLREYHHFVLQCNEALRTLLQDLALQEFSPADVLQLCAWIAEYYKHQEGPEALYRTAHYQALSGQWKQVAHCLLQLSTEPDQLFTGHCELLYGWLKHILAENHHPERQRLLELAGNCATYLGFYKDAATFYQQVKDVMPITEPNYPQLLAHLLRVYEACGDRLQAQWACQELLRCPSAPPFLRALGIAYQSGADLFAEPEQTVVMLHQAIALLGEPTRQWMREEKESWVWLHDALARAETRCGRIDHAIAILRQVYTVAESIPSLQARLDNNLAYIHYYACRHAEDIETAKRLFEQALKRRGAIKDQIGIMRSAQNLANLLINRARNRADWEAAESHFRTAEAAAAKVQSADRALIIANHIDALIHQGAFGQAQLAVESVNVAEVHDIPTRILLLLNRAKLALWMDQRDVCRAALRDALSPVADANWDLNKIEWAQISLEWTIRLDEPDNLHVGDERKRMRKPEATAVEWMQVIPRPMEEQSDVAEWLFAWGLLYLIGEQYDKAQEQFAESAAIWHRLAYNYRAAIVQYWQTYSFWCAKHNNATRVMAHQTEDLLVPFGASPIRERLQRLRDQFE